MAESKQAQLVAAVAEGVYAKLAPGLDKILTAIASNQARLEALELPPAAGPKRAVRAGTAAKPAKAGAAKKATGDARDKVTNALLYYRWTLANNLDDVRSTISEDKLEEAKQDAAVAKIDAVKEEAKHWSAIGALLWKTSLTKAEQETIRKSFQAWKEEIARETADAQLEPDAEPADGAAEGAGDEEQPAE